MSLPEVRLTIGIPGLRRYLVGFSPRTLTHLFTDVLVIGGGLAGVRAALEIQPPLDVVLVTKDTLTQSASSYAQGGIAGVLGPEDQFESHVEDTLAAGKGLCERDVVEMVVREGPQRIRELEEWGTYFDRSGTQLALAREGGHSHPRVVHALGDATGREVMRTVLERLRGKRNVAVYEHTFTLDLLSSEGSCHGALVWNSTRGFQAIWAKQTILATGGAGRLYRETTNPPVATGDGVAMAYRAGCEVRDLEFVQFHPTALYIAGSARHLITEAVRGEGAYLRDASGYRFMPDYHPQAELAPRDVVARAIAQQMVHTKHPCVYLDLTHLPAEFIRQRFPGITAVCAEFGLDVTREWIPVRPAAHYTVGGVKTDLEGRATLANLWACGEVASTGLHGANRLASNSLLEGLVFGALCGAAAAREAARMADTYQIQPVESPGGDRERRDYDLHDLTNSVRSLMGRNVAIERTADTLQDALRQLEFWAKFALQAEFDGPEGWELQNILTVAYLVTTAAWTRTESRGCHFRSDFPHTDDQRWRCHLTLLAAPNQR